MRWKKLREFISNKWIEIRSISSLKRICSWRPLSLKIGILGILALTSMGSQAATPVQIDPVLTEMIIGLEYKAKQALKAQDIAMTMMGGGYEAMQKEVKGTYQLQQKFNEYLDCFNGVLAFAAQSYGFYHEVGQLSNNFGSLVAQLKDSPTNAIAVALTPRRNQIYRDLIISSADIVNDVRKICLSDVKMTEKERIDILFSIRPKLKKINRKMKHLALAVKYTSLNDVWMELDHTARTPVDKVKVSDAAFERWKRSGKVTISGSGNGGNTWPGGSIVIPPSPPIVNPPDTNVTVDPSPPTGINPPSGAEPPTIVLPPNPSIPTKPTLPVSPLTRASKTKSKVVATSNTFNTVK